MNRLPVGKKFFLEATRMVARHIRLFAPVLLFLALFAVPLFAVGAPETTAKNGPRKVAFLVGVNNYDHGLAPLSYAERDVEELGKELGGRGFEVVWLTGRQATRRNIEAQLKILLNGKDDENRIKKGDILLASFCGHGGQFKVGDTEDAFFCPIDAFPDRPQTLFGLTDLVKAIGKTRGSTNLILMDACRNDIKLNRGVRDGVEGFKVDLPPNTSILFGCSRGETSREDQAYCGGHGLFTSAVLRGLRGEAANKDGCVTWAGLADRVREVMATDEEFLSKLSGKPIQTPKVVGGEMSRTVLLHFTPDPIKDSTEVRADKPKTVTLDLDGVKLELVRIEPGTFHMGATPGDSDAQEAENPRHAVEISKPFYLGKFHVTRGQFRAFVKATGRETEAEEGEGAFGWNGQTEKWVKDKAYNWKNLGFAQTDEHPVVCVSWDDTVAFCNWLSVRKGVELNRNLGGKWRVKLPTEAQWEYACRAGTEKRFHFGDDDEDLATYGNVADASARRGVKAITWGNKADDGYVFTAPVGQFRPNAWGLRDMHGNAWQWCEDYYDAKFYAKGDKRDLVNLQKGGGLIFPGHRDQFRPTAWGLLDVRGTARVLRGGSWNNPARYCRAACRGMGWPGDRIGHCGFRIAVRQD